MKKTLSVKEFAKLVNHHSENNIKEFRKRLRFYNVIENNQRLNEELVPVWEDICKVHENGVFWVPAMDQVIANLKLSNLNINTDFEEVKTNQLNDHPKIDVVISLLQEILVELRKK